MTTAISVDLAALAREIELPVEQVERTLQLLDDGNTIPFITRYRKDRTGGLNEEQIERIQQEAVKARLLAERKQTILRSIASQGKLTPELEAKINSARTLKWLEDVYLPFKPKKQTLATIARQRGLEPLAREILDANPEANDLQARAATFVAPENGLSNVDDVLQGVKHILAEWFSERVDLRGRLRKSLRREGVLTCSRIEPAPAADANSQQPSATQVGAGEETNESRAVERIDQEVNRSAIDSAAPTTMLPADVAAHSPLQEVAEDTAGATAHVESAAEPASLEQPPQGDEKSSSNVGEKPDPQQSADERLNSEVAGQNQEAAHAEKSAAEVRLDAGQVTADAGESSSSAAVASAGEVSDAPPPLPVSEGGSAPAKAASDKGTAPLKSRVNVVKTRAMRKQLAKERKKKLLEHAFKDYYNFRESLSRLPPHRILAINRGERAKVLRVKIDYNAEAMIQDAIRQLVPQGHVHTEFLTTCARDSLQRLVLPSLERELRRELADEAEQHAVQVFVRNLRKLLLQPPVRSKRVLAVDPGFRSGCKLAAVDPFGKLLDSGMISLIGGDEQRAHARAKLADFIRRNQTEIVAIGNGAGCRSAEHLVSDVIGSELADMQIAYVIVNEAGASFYSTSQIGRDELPHCDPMMRSAVSIGRRLQDPLSELVKINPAHIGVGMYQHDMKLKHLRESLDKVVNSCVNFVGVELNSASPSLLGYVSGLNQLTARRVFEFRQQHGPFRNREQIKSVPGIGEATYVQAAGFLRISDGDNPLDATWIHPESYDIAQRVLERLEISLRELSGQAQKEPGPAPTAYAPSTAGQADSTACVAQPDATDVDREIAVDATQASQPENTAAEDATPTPEASSAERETELAAPQPTTESSSETLASQVAEGVATLDAAAQDVPDAVAPSGSLAPDFASLPEIAANELPSDEPAPTADPAVAQPADPQTNVASQSTAATSPPTGNGKSLAERLAAVDVSQMSRELGIGELLLRDILAALAKPGRDPRDEFSPPPFRTGIMKLEDLKPGMVLQGTVLNVVDFGAFVDIGISDSALIHISKLADQFIRDPQEVVSVGDILKVWVIAVDKERRRVSLSAVDPDQAKQQRPPREPRGRRPKGPQQAQTSGTAPPAGRPPRPQVSRQQQQQQRPPKKFTPPAGKRAPGKSNTRTTPPKPKPVRPITSAMLTGKQPMRSFSDLMQFYEKKQQDGEEPNK